MNHLNLTSHAAVEGAHMLTTTRDGSRIDWWQDDNEATATIGEDETTLTLTIAKAMRSPVVIANDAEKELVIALEAFSAAHVVILVRGTECITVNCAPHSHAQVYLVPEDDHELSCTAHVAAHARLSLFEFGMAANIGQRDISVALADTKASLSYFGLDQLNAHEKKNTHLIINHQGCDTTSTQWFRGIYGGEAVGSFLGQVVIEKNARLSSAKQLYKSIILSEKAKAHAKPELVIFNHDISASHGATIGELDEEALFYLRSRGMPLRDAKALLIESFIEEALLNIEVRELREAFAKRSSKSITRLLGNGV